MTDEVPARADARLRPLSSGESAGGAAQKGVAVEPLEGSDARELYLRLLKRALLHTLYSPPDIGTYDGRVAATRWLWRTLRRRGIVRLKRVPDAERFRAEGRDWPIFAQTMVGRARLDNLHDCVERVLADGVPGDLVETGVWRGGCSILMRGILRAHGVTDRTVFVADSFEGLPAPDARYPKDAEGQFHTSRLLQVSLDEVRDNFRRYELLDDQVRFLPGWFRDTLPGVADRTWSVVRLDGDMYESTMDGLRNLYPGLSIGGFLIADDYSIDACREAIEDFRREHAITEEIHHVDWTGVVWRRER